MIKRLCFIFLLLLMGIFNAQTFGITQSTKDSFKGYWAWKAKYCTNAVAIDSESGKDFAVFIDIGTGEVSPPIFQATMKGIY